MALWSGVLIDFIFTMVTCSGVTMKVMHESLSASTLWDESQCRSVACVLSMRRRNTIRVSQCTHLLLL